MCRPADRVKIDRIRIQQSRKKPDPGPSPNRLDLTIRKIPYPVTSSMKNLNPFPTYLVTGFKLFQKPDPAVSAPLCRRRGNELMLIRQGCAEKLVGSPLRERKPIIIFGRSRRLLYADGLLNRGAHPQFFWSICSCLGGRIRSTLT